MLAKVARVISPVDLTRLNRIVPLPSTRCRDSTSSNIRSVGSINFEEVVELVADVIMGASVEDGVYTVVFEGVKLPYVIADLYWYHGVHVREQRNR
jgi:hypothetical protein